MGVFDLFSKRQKRLRGEVPDVYSYDKIPQELRVQIVHIIRDAIGQDQSRYSTTAHEVYEAIHNAICREYGVFRLAEGYDDDYERGLFNYLLSTDQTDRVIDIVELAFQTINGHVRQQFHVFRGYTEPKITPDEAIEELNERFKEHGIGYSFTGGEIIRVDSTYAHSEITKPTIALLHNAKFKGANEEYLKAHEHYRHGRNKECLNECLKAFESTMKTICKEKGWTFNQTDTASKLIQVCFQNELVPSFVQNQFTSLRSLLESGIPTIRNKLGGHGQGQTPQEVDDEMTRYGLNLTGTNIIFLIEMSGIR